jgi:hypothetical protein
VEGDSGALPVVAESTVEALAEGKAYTGASVLASAEKKEAGNGMEGVEGVVMGEGEGAVVGEVLAEAVVERDGEEDPGEVVSSDSLDGPEGGRRWPAGGRGVVKPEGPDGEVGDCGVDREAGEGEVAGATVEGPLRNSSRDISSTMFFFPVPEGAASSLLARQRERRN